MEVDKVKEYNQKYYLNHKNDKFHCNACNKDYSVYIKSKHIKTPKHIKNEKNTIVNNESPIDKIIKMALSLGQKIEMKDNKLIIE